MKTNPLHNLPLAAVTPATSRDFKVTSSKTIGSALAILASAALVVSAAEESPTTRISVMSYNIENGGAKVGSLRLARKNSLGAKQSDFILGES
jgi:hypothetical protein